MPSSVIECSSTVTVTQCTVIKQNDKVTHSFEGRQARQDKTRQATTTTK